MHADPKDKGRGLYQKYEVTRTDGRSAPGEKHHGCRYFVLDIDHDPMAAVALEAYLQHAQFHYPQLAEDLRGWAKENVEKLGGVQAFHEANGMPVYGSPVERALREKRDGR